MRDWRSSEGTSVFTNNTEDNIDSGDNNKAIVDNKKKLALLNTSVAEFEAKVNAITANDIFDNKFLLKSLAHRFIKRIEVGDDIMIEFFDI